MRVLAIDCASEACSVALFDGDELLGADHRMLGRGHAEQLIPMIAGLPDKGKAGQIAVSLGPGSFTGVRIGLAAARALALAWGAEAFGYPTLALIAAMARAEAGDQPVSVAMTGGHGQWFMQNFAAGGAEVGALVSLAPNAALSFAEHDLVAGTQAEELVADRGRGTALPVWPNAAQFLHLPKEALTAQLTPLYGRAPDARLPQEASA